MNIIIGFILQNVELIAASFAAILAVTGTGIAVHKGKKKARQEVIDKVTNEEVKQELKIVKKRIKIQDILDGDNSERDELVKRVRSKYAKNKRK